MTPAERRRAPRIAEQLTLAIGDIGAQLTAETKNLSASGVYCALDRFLPPMSKLQLHFALPDGARRKTIRCEGVVVRVEPVITDADRGRYHVAIFFTELTERDRATISRFVRQRLSTTPATD